jgi:hypothetical protein
MGGPDPPCDLPPHATEHGDSTIDYDYDDVEQPRGASVPAAPLAGGLLPAAASVPAWALKFGPARPSGPFAPRFPSAPYGPTNPSGARPPASGGAAAAGPMPAASSGANMAAGPSGVSAPDFGKMLKLHSFRGDRGDDVGGWLFQAREVLSLLAWPDEAKIVYLGQFLHGPAASFYRRFRQTMCDGTVATLLRALKHTFQMHAEDEHWRARLDRLAAGTRGLSVAEYTRQFNECLFHLPSIDTAECIRLYVKGLPLHVRKDMYTQYLRGAFTPDAHGFADAVAEANQFEVADRMTRTSLSGPQGGSHDRRHTSFRAGGQASGTMRPAGESRPSAPGRLNAMAKGSTPAPSGPAPASVASVSYADRGLDDPPASSSNTPPTHFQQPKSGKWYPLYHMDSDGNKWPVCKFCLHAGHMKTSCPHPDNRKARDSRGRANGKGNGRWA